MQKESVFKEVFNLIKDDNLESGLKIISKHLLRDCVMLMSSKTITNDKYELYSLFHDNFLDFATKVKEGRFEYKSDSAFISFFKTGCSHRAKEHRRLYGKNDDWLSVTDFESHSDELDNIFQENKTNEYKSVYETYGINLEDIESKEVFPLEVIKGFHSMNEKCKFLLVMKYMLNLSHKNIVDCLCNFYELKNENVSKSELKRCIERLKKTVAA